MLSPTLRTMLRGALIPLGLGLLTRGVSDLHEAVDTRRAELADLTDRVELHRQALAGEVPLSALDEDQAAVPDLENFGITSNGNSVTRRRRRWLAWGVLGLGIGYVAARGAAELAARAELAAAESAEISAALMSQPPAPGSPADLAAGNRCGVEPAYGGEACTLPPHKSYAHSWEDGTGDDEDQAPGEFPHTDTAAIGGAGDPYACQPCGWFAPAGPRDDRALALTLHNNANHAAGLPGR